MTTKKMNLHLVRVFSAPGLANGGNPAPIVLQADGMSVKEMREVASRYGHESGFVMRASSPECHSRMRYFVPNHEMEMCGHATVGALWVLLRNGLWDGEPIKVETLSGHVNASMLGGKVAISQPTAIIEELSGDQVSQIAEALNVDENLIQGQVLNASTSRVKTLVRLRDLSVLRELRPNWDSIEPLCSSIGSTGIYPFAIVDAENQVYEARQFPKSSGYPEDAATGIAATALAYGLRSLGLAPHTPVRVNVRQGVSMGSPSLIIVELPDRNYADHGCWLSGDVGLYAGNDLVKAEHD